MSEPVGPLPTPRGLVAKLAAVMAGIKHVPKRGRNAFHGYDYATEADIADAVREGLAEQGVMIFPSVEKLEWRSVETKSGAQAVATLHVRFCVTDGVETREFLMLGEGQDGGDKATYKAMTGAQKYMLLKLFLISTGDDPEADDAPRKPEAPKPAPAKRASSTADHPPLPPREPGDDDEPTRSPKGAMMPPCPHCKSSKAVIKNRFTAGEYVCWEKSTRGKGCGRKFSQSSPTETKPATEPPECPACGSAEAVQSSAPGEYLCTKSAGGCGQEWRSR